MTPFALRRMIWVSYVVTVATATVWFWQAPSLGRVVEAYLAVILATALILALAAVLDWIGGH